MAEIKKEIKKCNVWFCPEDGYSSQGYCTRHQRQFTRTGNPLAGEDAKLLNNMCLQLRHLMRALMLVAVTEDHNDIAHCHVCGRASAPHGKINHLPLCEALEAKNLLLSERTPKE